MSTKVFIPQPIPEVAVNRLREMAEVEVFPHVDRVIGDEDLLEAVKGKNYLYALGEVQYPEKVIEAAGKRPGENANLF